MTGCTISVILFMAAMNLLVKSVERKTRGPQMESAVKQPLIRAFMDEMTITTKSVTEARWTLEELELGTHEIQACKVKELGIKEREG